MALLGNCLRRWVGIRFALPIFHYVLERDGFDKVTTHIFDPDDHYIRSDAVFGVKESLMAEFKPVDDPARAAEHGFSGRYYDVEHDFVLAPLRA